MFQLDAAVAAEAQLNRWDTTQYVRFEPAVRGKFKWTGERELTFSPLEPFRPTTAFTATLQPQYLLPSQQKSPPALDRTRFHTPYLELREAQAWVGGKVGGRRARAEMRAHAALQLPCAAGRGEATAESESGGAAGGV
ncbi:MAG: hypothetical protein WKG07_27545 [Hymenobacter sp.]